MRNSPKVLLTCPSSPLTLNRMASYSHFLGHNVTVNYRVGDILLPASGTLVGDSGRSIFLEQHVEQRGRLNYFRWEIPYQYIHRIAEVTVSDQAVSPAEPNESAPNQPESPARPAALAARAGSGVAGGLLSFPQRPKTV